MAASRLASWLGLASPLVGSEHLFRVRLSLLLRLLSALLLRRLRLLWPPVLLWPPPLVWPWLAPSGMGPPSLGRISSRMGTSRRSRSLAALNARLFSRIEKLLRNDSKARAVFIARADLFSLWRVRCASCNTATLLAWSRHPTPIRQNSRKKPGRKAVQAAPGSTGNTSPLTSGRDRKRAKKDQQ
jgi:hypothetical protein